MHAFLARLPVTPAAGTLLLLLIHSPHAARAAPFLLHLPCNAVCLHLSLHVFSSFHALPLVTPDVQPPIPCHFPCLLLRSHRSSFLPLASFVCKQESQRRLPLLHGGRDTPSRHDCCNSVTGSLFPGESRTEEGDEDGGRHVVERQRERSERVT